MKVIYWILWATSAPAFVGFTFFLILLALGILHPTSFGLNASDIPETLFFATVFAIPMLSPLYLIGILKGVWGLELKFRFHLSTFAYLILVSIIWLRYFLWGIVEPGVGALVLLSVYIVIVAISVFIFDHLIPAR